MQFMNFWKISVSIRKKKCLGYHKAVDSKDPQWALGSIRKSEELFKANLKLTYRIEHLSGRYQILSSHYHQPYQQKCDKVAQSKQRTHDVVNHPDMQLYGVHVDET